MSEIVDKERLINSFVDLVKISSPSWQEEGVIRYISRVLKNIKVDCEKHKCGKSHNLLVRLNGDNSRKPILFSCHMDTVIPCDNVIPVITETKISSDGASILGADDKAAIAAFIEAIYCVKKNNIPHGNIEFLFSCAEELGLCGIKDFDLSVLRAKFGFVFDSNGTIGGVILQAPFHSIMDVRIKGKAAHAGIEPEKGISAIRIASEMICKLPHGRIDDETTVNVGLLSGGKATNIVADETNFKLEARSLNKQKLAAIEEKIEKTIYMISKNNKVKAIINKHLEYSGYSIKQDDTIIQIVNNAMKKIAITPSFHSSGGGSDTNIINKAGIKAVNLSIGMKNVHTNKEYINIKDLYNGTRLVLSIIDAA